MSNFDVLQRNEKGLERKVAKFHLMRGFDKYEELYKKFQRYVSNVYKNVSFLNILDDSYIFEIDPILVNQINEGNIKADPSVIYLNILKYKKKDVDFYTSERVVNHYSNDKILKKYNNLVNKYYPKGSRLYFNNFNVKLLAKNYNVNIDIKDFLNDTRKTMLFIIYNFAYKGGIHTTAMIINKKTKTMEVFDPHGAISYNNFFINLEEITGVEKFPKDFLDSFTIKYLRHMVEIKFNKKFLDGEYKIKNNIIICPNFGPQALAQQIEFENMHRLVAEANKKVGKNRGYCFPWSLFFMYYRLKYNNSEPEEVYKIIKEKVKKICENLSGCDPRVILYEKIKFFISELMKL
jgi:hypothetical protein